MLNHFDTVFAFVAVMAGVSLIVTTLTQTVGALFAFRGRHLRWGLSSLLENYAPELRAEAEALSGHLLNHPLVSDSMFSRRGWVPLNWVTRGLHFFWRGWKYATAVRPEELRAIVANLAENMPETAPAVERALAAIGKAKNPQDAYDAVAAEVSSLAQLPKLANYWTQIAGKYARATQDLTTATMSGAEAKAQWVREVTGMFAAMKSVGILEAKLKGDAGTSVTSVNTVRTTWDRWFDSTMDRVSQRFGTNMRIWTVVFAFVIAAVGGLDSLALYQKLSSDAELTAKLILGTDALQDRYRTLGTQAADRSGAGTVPAEDLKAVQASLVKVQSMMAEQQDLGIFSGRKAYSRGCLGILGCLASAILLSLGAPFWFNALKKMANLRPLLANKTEAGG